MFLLLGFIWLRFQSTCLVDVVESCRHQQQHLKLICDIVSSSSTMHWRVQLEQQSLLETFSHPRNCSLGLLLGTSSLHCPSPAYSTQSPTPGELTPSMIRSIAARSCPSGYEGAAPRTERLSDRCLQMGG